MIQNSTDQWLSEKVFTEGNAFFEGLFNDIKKAEKSIYIETFIYRDDSLGLAFSSLLEECVKRGIRVRLMVDGAGSFLWLGKLYDDWIQKGIDVRVYRPAPFSFHIRKLQNLRGLRNFWFLLARINRRNHRKICVIDDKIAWVGSHNITDIHLEKVHGSKAWRDTGVRVEGEAVTELSCAFENAWSLNRNLSRFFRRTKKCAQMQNNSDLVRTNQLSRFRRKHFQDLLSRITSAKERVWVTTPYFVPNFQFIKALKNSARNGVDVRVLIPQTTDIGLVHWAARFFYGILLEGGIRIFEYLPSFLHAKTIMIDNWATIGSSNLNQRSHIHDLEVDVVIKKTKNLEKLERSYLSDLSHSCEVALKDWRKAPWWHNLISRFVMTFKYFL